MWHMTIAELKPLINMKLQLTDQQSDIVKWAVWHIVALDRQKRLPSLTNFMSKKRTLEKARPLYGEEAEKARAEHLAIMQQMGVTS